MIDETEGIRRQMVGVLNSRLQHLTEEDQRHALEEEYGENNVWNTSEFTKEFEAIGFLAPFVDVRRRSDGVKGSIEFQHMPRFYFNFVKDDRR